MNVQFTDRARSDLRSIVTYSKRKFGSQQAAIYVTQLKELVRLLSDTPGMGKKRDELAHGLRSFPFQSHVLYYIIQGKQFIVIRVLHKLMESSLHISE
jgi:toxin ParE1/3/4